MSTITKANLEHLCKMINEATGNNQEPYTKNADGTFTPNAGTYTLSGAYGGWKLEQMCKGGGTRSITNGYVSKRDLYYQMSAYLDGIEAGKRN